MLRNIARIDRHISRRHIIPISQGLLAQIVEELLLLDPFSRSGLTLLTISGDICGSRPCDPLVDSARGEVLAICHYRWRY